MDVCLTWWSAAQEHRRGLYNHHSSLLCTPQTSSTKWSPVICRNTQDDFAVVLCISDGQETEYRELVDCFEAWCGNNHIILNVNKTKEMIVDFRRTRFKSNSISIMGEEVEMMEEYKDLGVHLDSRLQTGLETQH